jgi:hypothetical protein
LFAGFAGNSNGNLARFLLYFRKNDQGETVRYDQTLLYEKGYTITVNNPGTPLYYYFDYDSRSHHVNMDFHYA